MILENGHKIIENGIELEPEISVLIATSQIEGGVFETDIKATKEQRIKLASRFGLIELKSFHANFKASLLPSELCILVEGDFKAKVVQQCVVTLEPVSSDVKGILYCKYSESPEIEGTGPIDFDLMTEEPTELIVDGQFDVGIILSEQLGLELNSFPRSSGISFDAPSDFSFANKLEKRGSNPFDVLKKFK
jgi:uncharacterized metal-binding protein YceD (DUF177 family)